MVDWQEMKTEYITTETSYRKLSKKYGIGYQAICQRSKDEGWIAQREQYRNETTTKIIDAISDQEVDRATKLYSVADKLLDKVEAMVDNIKPTDAKALRSITAALKDLKEIKGIKSSIDKQEQEARIANLRRQADKDDAKNDDIQVTFAGALEDYSE